MATEDACLAMALELLTHAEIEADPVKRAGLETLAANYRRVAEQKQRSRDFISDRPGKN